jgi:hypothetical protein
MRARSAESPPNDQHAPTIVDKQTGQAIVVGLSAPGALADASNRTGLPKDCFEVHQISREEYEAFRGWKARAEQIVAKPVNTDGRLKERGAVRSMGGRNRLS